MGYKIKDINLKKVFVGRRVLDMGKRELSDDIVKIWKIKEKI